MSGTRQTRFSVSALCVSFLFAIMLAFALTPSLAYAEKVDGVDGENPTAQVEPAASENEADNGASPDQGGSDNGEASAATDGDGEAAAEIQPVGDQVNPVSEVEPQDDPVDDSTGASEDPSATPAGDEPAPAVDADESSAEGDGNATEEAAPVAGDSEVQEPVQTEVEADEAADNVSDAGETSQVEPVASAAQTEPSAEPLAVKAAATTATLKLSEKQRQDMLKGIADGLQGLVGLGDGKKITYTSTIPGQGISGSALQAALKLLMNDVQEDLKDIFWMYPQFFYYDSFGISASCRPQRTGDVIVTFTFSPTYLYTRQQTQKMIGELDTALDGALSWVPSGSASDAQKAKAAHDWLVRNCVYDMAASKVGDPAIYGRNPWTSYGALVNKKAVCQGYAYAFKLMMDKLGITCTYVTNTAHGETHGWNRVLIDGAWYNVDATHDDPVYSNGKDAGYYVTPSTRYFLKSDAWFVADSDNGLHKAYSPKGKAATATLYDNGTNNGAAWKVYGPTGSTIKLVAQTSTYNGKVQAYTGSVTRTGSTGKVTYTYYTDANCTKVASKVLNAGMYYVKATLAANGGYQSATSAAVKLVINKAASSIALTNAGKVTKKGSTKGVTYRYYSDANCKKEVKAANVKSGKTYYVKASVAADTNFNGATSKAARIKMKASSIKLAAQTKTYTGKALAYSGKVTKKGAAGAVTYRYYTDAKCKKEIKASKVKAARTYYVKATVAATGPYAAATSAPVKFTVKKAASKASSTAPLAVSAASTQTTTSIKDDAVALSSGADTAKASDVAPLASGAANNLAEDAGMFAALAAALLAAVLAIIWFVRRRNGESNQPVAA